jgi:hypothetical protein
MIGSLVGGEFAKLHRLLKLERSPPLAGPTDVQH